MSGSCGSASHQWNGRRAPLIEPACNRSGEASELGAFAMAVMVGSRSRRLRLDVNDVSISAAD
jgi:hypothetical protein